MPIPSKKHGRPNRRTSASDSQVIAASSAEHSGIIGLVIDPRREGTGQIVRGAFGVAGLRLMHLTQAAMPTACYVAMVGRILREPARVVACLPDAAELAVEAAFEKARDLGDTSTWFVHLPDEHQGAVLALLARLTATAGPMQ